MFKNMLFDDSFDDVLKDLDDFFKDANFDSAKTSTYTLKLTPDKEKGYNINYKVDDGNGKLDITAEGSNIDECVNNLIDNLKAETVKKEDESVDEKLLSLEKQNQRLKEVNEDLCKTIENLIAEKDKLEAENIELQDMNDDLVISLNQITSAVDKVNTWFSEI